MIDPQRAGRLVVAVPVLLAFLSILGSYFLKLPWDLVLANGVCSGGIGLILIVAYLISKVKNFL